MRLAIHLTTILALAALTGIAQAPQPKPELLLFHPSGPPLSYDVATIKPIDPSAADRAVRLPSNLPNPLSILRYVMDAYGAMYPAQVVGGPDWLIKDAYNIKGKVPDDIEAAQQKMKRQDRIDQNKGMQQSLLADRFHLKAHFETRVLPVYEIVPAKEGLKITAVPAPPERKPGDPLPPPHPGDPLSPGSSITMLNSNGLRVYNGRAIQMSLFVLHLQRRRWGSSHRRPHWLYWLLGLQGPDLGAPGRRWSHQHS